MTYFQGGIRKISKEDYNNILLRQELEKKNRVKPENEQAKINEITSNQHFIIKAIRKFGRIFQTQYVQYSEHNNDGTIDDPIKSDKETEETATTITTNQVF